MIKYRHNPIINPGKITPSNHDLVVKGSLNPGAVRYKDEILLLLRIAEGCRSIKGKVSVPVYRFEGTNRTLEVLHLEETDPDLVVKDTRAVVYRGKEYVSTLSHLRLARSHNGIDFVVDEKPFLVPQNESEEFGIEDARVVHIDDYYYINYTAVSRDSYGTSMIRTRDFKTIEYLGMVFCPPNKDVCIFPEKIGGVYYALSRPYNHDFGKSSIWIAESEDLLHWGNHKCLIRPASNKWEMEKIGGGAPPIKTDKGWLEIYHGNTIKDGRDFYSLMVLLLDLDDPSRVVYRGDHPIIMPEEVYETDGFVPNVVFLNGMVLKDENNLLLYYSACDETTCLAECSLGEIVPGL